ncbi:MAG: hypothetical protein JWQ02_1284 [Capsulimonas sp.]|nr:hypothetical protein [Capsulimonas sp.]
MDYHFRAALRRNSNVAICRFAVLSLCAGFVFGILSRAEAQTPAKFLVTAPATTVAGTAASVTVTAADAGDKVISSYVGTVKITSSDPQAVLPADAALKNGVGTFNVTLKKAGSSTITATDAAASSVTGVSGAVAVTHGVVHHLYVTIAPASTSGKPTKTAVSAKDVYNNTVLNYTGSVKVTSSDAAAVLPADGPLPSGFGVFNITLNTVGSQTMTATDTATPTLTGVSRPTTVAAP